MKGVVLDAHSKDPIPFANVYLKSNPTKGTAADFDGLFELQLGSPPDTLAASALGYNVLVFPYNGKEELKIELSSSSVNLVEVVVRADGEDPAYALMRKVVARKPQNDPLRKDYYSSEVYNKMQLDFINVTEEFKNMKLNRPFRFVFDHIDSLSEDEPFLPMFITESLSDYHYQKDPRRHKEVIKAVKLIGDYENESMGQLVGVAKQTLNPYDDWMDMVTKKFVSPVADNGAAHYRFYLIDSALIDNKWCYQVQFFPKHKGVNAFNGDLWVHDTTFAIKRIKLQLLEEGHLNHIEKLTLVHSFQMVGDSAWMPQRDNILITTNTLTEAFVPSFFKKLNEAAPGIQAKRTTTYKDFQFERKQSVEEMNVSQMLTADAFEKDDDFGKTTAIQNWAKTSKPLVFWWIRLGHCLYMKHGSAFRRPCSRDLCGGIMWTSGISIRSFRSTTLKVFVPNLDCGRAPR